jgi:hypothetical protein
MNDSPPQTDELVLNEFPPPIPVSITGRNGTTRYLVVESHGPKEYWETLRLIRRQEVTDGDDHIVAMPELVVRLISLCLTTADGKPVPEATIQGWGQQAKLAVFEKVKRMNHLGENKKEDPQVKPSGDEDESGGGTTSPSA